jgi:hypothetical protein
MTASHREQGSHQGRDREMADTALTRGLRPNTALLPSRLS